MAGSGKGMRKTRNVSRNLNPEQALIAETFATLAEYPGAFGLKDDAARITARPGCDLIVTSDTLVAGVHFLSQDSAQMIARKALRVNLSDLAAKGAQAKYYLVNIAVPESLGPGWLKRFAKGLALDQKLFGATLIGGDTVRTPGALTISITAHGIVPSGAMVRRSGARPGDNVYVSGTIGDAVLGLAVIEGDGRFAGNMSRADAGRLAARYRLPEPRLGLARALRKYASAAIDVSDGLAGDLAQLCAASKVTARIELAAVPLSRAARRCLGSAPEAIERLITGGDDYEILCAVPPKKSAGFERAAKRAHIPVCPIGMFCRGGDAPVFLKPDKTALKLEQMSYSHF